MNAPISSPDGPPSLQPTNAPVADTTGGVIPYKNPSALLAYYIGLFSLMPVFGLAMGPAAFILGLKGLRYAKEFPVVKGQAHAWVGLVCGGFCSSVSWIGLLMLIGMLASR